MIKESNSKVRSIGKPKIVKDPCKMLGLYNTSHVDIHNTHIRT